MSRPDVPRHLLAVALAALLSTPLAQACGPDFPLRLLSDRATSLAELPEGNFSFEARRLAVAVPGLKAAEPYERYSHWDEQSQRYLEEIEIAEPKGLTTEQAAKVRELRQLGDAAQAEAAGAALPAELRWYTAGAVAFAQGEDALAQRYFRQVLALPAEERALRSTWAAYSLARSLARGIDGARDASLTDEQLQQARQADREATRQALRQTRQLAIDGFSDPMELGIASLGEEARLELDAGDWSAAIGLYAAQLQLGSSTGYSSLKELAVALAKMPEAQLAERLKALPVQQLLTAYLLSHASWSYGEQPQGEDKLLRLLQRADVVQMANADRLAAVSYQFGDYAATATLLDHAPDNGLTWWLRAKLAVRAGDKAAAQLAYAKAAQAFPEDESWGVRRDANWNSEVVKPRCRAMGEGAILALERGDYLDAFEALYRSGYLYWSDTAEVAERVLSVDELKAFVDANVPALPAIDSKPDPYSYQPRPVEAQLRELLGRRLLREGRYDEAPAYFYERDLQAAAQAYGRARQAGESRWTDTGKAEALYQAGKLARAQGMELLGYEMSPDFASFGGLYALDRVAAQEPGPLLTRDEAERQNANLAQPNNRYHYRWVAADLASQAAELLPQTSQAYAATLCRATGWILYSDFPLARRYYQRYVDNGPAVPWSGNFGQNCEEPDFEHVTQRLWAYRLDTAHKALRPYRGVLFGLMLVAGVLAAGYWRKRRVTVRQTQA